MLPNHFSLFFNHFRNNLIPSFRLEIGQFIFGNLLWSIYIIENSDNLLDIVLKEGKPFCYSLLLSDGFMDFIWAFAFCGWFKNLLSIKYLMLSRYNPIFSISP